MTDKERLDRLEKTVFNNGIDRIRNDVRWLKYLTGGIYLALVGGFAGVIFGCG